MGRYQKAANNSISSHFCLSQVLGQMWMIYTRIGTISHTLLALELVFPSVSITHGVAHCLHGSELHLSELLMGLLLVSVQSAIWVPAPLFCIGILQMFSNPWCPSESLELKILRWEMVIPCGPKWRTLEFANLDYAITVIWVNYENLDILTYRKNETPNMTSLILHMKKSK